MERKKVHAGGASRTLNTLLRKYPSVQLATLVDAAPEGSDGYTRSSSTVIACWASWPGAKSPCAREMVSTGQPSFHPSRQRSAGLRPRTEAGHEFGHALYDMQIGSRGASDTRRSDQSALDLENKVRRVRGPNAPVRTVH